MTSTRSQSGRGSRGHNRTSSSQRSNKRTRTAQKTAHVGTNTHETNDSTSTRQVEDSTQQVEDDAMSVDTDTANNTNHILSIFATFLTLRFDVKASQKGSEVMRLKLSSLYKVLLQADATLQFSFYQKDIIKDAESGKVITNVSDVLDNPDNIPTSITAMSKFFMGQDLIVKEEPYGHKFVLSIRRR